MNAPGGGAPKSSLGWTILAGLIGLIFVYAGVIKILRPMAFATDIAHFHVLPWPLGIRMAFYLPWLELLCGLALISGWMRTGAVGILTALTVIFLVASVAARLRGIDINCGCFGSAGKGLSFSWHMLLDLGILIGLVALFFSPLMGRRAARV